MLPRILHQSTGIARRCSQRQHKVTIYTWNGIAQASHQRPPVNASLPEFRTFSVKKSDGSGSNPSSTLVSDKVAKDTNVKKGSLDSVSSTTPSIDNTSNPETDKAGALKSSPTPPMPSSAATTQVSQTTTPKVTSASTISTKESASNTSSLLSSEETPNSQISTKKSVTGSPSKPSSGEKSFTHSKNSDMINGGALAEFYDKAFRLWSERSGTSEIYALKESVNEAGAAFDMASATVTTNRKNLDGALRKWERASGQHLQLLQRRESWTPEDAQRFADFVSLEITSRAELEQARHDLGRSEELLTKSQLDYINKMRRRYHEEQIWQDQWRVLGTYGTWTLIVLNSCVFLGSQFFQKRREQDRTETIERLIRESRSEVILSKVPNAEMDHGTAMTHESAISNENQVNEKATTRTEIKEGVTLKSEEEGVEIAKDHSADTSKNQEPNQGLHPAIERMGKAIESVGSFVNRWEHKARSRTKESLGSLYLKIQQGLPAHIADDMPKSVSEVHVPSAVIGASISGIVILSISIIVSTVSSRRY